MAFHVEDISLKYAAISPVDSRVILGPIQHSDVYIYVCVCVCIKDKEKSSWGLKKLRADSLEISDPRLDPRYLEGLENDACRGMWGGTFRVVLRLHAIFTRVIHVIRDIDRVGRIQESGVRKLYHFVLEKRN